MNSIIDVDNAFEMTSFMESYKCLHTPDKFLLNITEKYEDVF